jgi:transcriptional regulator with XRE-family HTH domain
MLSLVTDLTREQYEAAGEWLVGIYEARGLNQTSLAKKAGVSTSMLRDLEKGGRLMPDGRWRLPNPRAANLYKIAGALETSAAEMGRRFGVEMVDVTQPEPSADPVEAVVAEVRALRSELRAFLDRVGQLLDQRPPQ